MTPRAFDPSEVVDSQLPAAMLLHKLGFTILNAAELREMRGGREANVLLEPVLSKQILALNAFYWKGETRRFNDGDAEQAIRKIRPSTSELKGLIATNQDIYDALMLGATVEKTVDGDKKSFTVRYIDWKNPDANVYHAAMEVSVQKTASVDTRRCDIVLYVNGIPFAVIENKNANKNIEQAVSQLIGYQNADQIPSLFHYAQMLIAVHRKEAHYATVGSGKKYWMVWKEADDPALSEMVNAPLSDDGKAEIFADGFEEHQAHFDHMAKAGAREVTEQDRILYALCRPERLLEFTRTFTVFDAGIRKVARHQQYFAVKQAMRRIRENDSDGRRRGGVIWHTQGSGKSLTMVMLGKALAFDREEVKSPRIVIVTDRIDLDKQIKNTFKACEMEPVQARTGKHLLQLLQGSATPITTVIDKFENASASADQPVYGRDIFVLVDESHRSNYGETAAKMRRLLPEACYIGFTGTPLLKREKSTLDKFGGMIHRYAIDEATADKAVVPLLYEGRIVDQRVSGPEIDSWFERLAEGLTDEQKGDLRRKMASAQLLSRTEQSLYAKAVDISEHYRNFWQGTGFKAQLVAPGRPEAIRMKEFFDQIGHVSSEIIMSAPDQREDNENVDEESKNVIRRFWDHMMKRYGNAEAYERSIVERFKGDEDPEILIVVSKLLTGFDAPRNTVLYLCKSMKEHNLLQAIARVNRLFEEDEAEKEFGHISDYQGVLGELDQALTNYSEFAGFDDDDVVDVVHSITDEIRRLRTLHGELWDVFKTLKNKFDMEAFELFLGEKPVRDEFYARLRGFGRCLHIGLGSEKIFDIYSQDEVETFKQDWKRFDALRKSVRIRYQEAISLKDYEPKIRALLDRHLIASPAEVIAEEVDITNPDEIDRVLQEQNISLASKADRIASATKVTISEKMDADPARYASLFEMLQEAIRAYREKRLSEKAYLDRVRELASEVASDVSSRSFPTSIKQNSDAQALYGILEGVGTLSDNVDNETIAEMCLSLLSIINGHLIVDFWENDGAQKALLNDLDDFLFDESRNKSLGITASEIDKILAEVMRVGKARFRR